MASQDIQLNFINNSNDGNNSKIVIFQSALSPSDYKLMAKLAAGEKHTVQLTGYSLQAYITGNATPSNMEPATAGQLIKAYGEGDTVLLAQHGNADNENLIQVLNGVIDTEITVNLFNNGALIGLEDIAYNAIANFPASSGIYAARVTNTDNEAAMMTEAMANATLIEIPSGGQLSADVVLVVVDETLQISVAAK